MQDRERKMLPRKDVWVLSIYIAVLASIGPAIMWLNSRQAHEMVAATPELVSRWKAWFGFNADEPVQMAMSVGTRILATLDNTPDKQAAAQAFAREDYATALKRLDASLATRGNDPEAVIYRSNARAALAGNPIKIGVSVPIGGNLDIAKEILRGVAQAQQEANDRGGIGGRLLQVEIANDNNDPRIAESIATQFARDEDILAVIGHNSSQASLAANPIYQAAGLVTISPTSTATELSGSGSYFFRTAPSTRVTASTLADYAVESARVRSIALCTDSQDGASVSFKEEFTWAVLEDGGRVTATACDFSADNFDPTTISAQATSDGADALLLAPSLATIDTALEVAQANRKQLTLLGNQTLYTYATLYRGQADVNGMVLAVAWHPDAFPKNPYLDRAKAMWGSAGSWRTAGAYDATWSAISGLQSGGINRNILQETLANPGFAFEGATGKVQFLSTGDRNIHGVLVQVRPGDGSGTGFDFVSLKPSNSLRTLAEVSNP
jgi:branched-chain amino acid transport system substrate-binding protein